MLGEVSEIGQSRQSVITKCLRINYSAGIYLFKVNNRNTTKSFEIRSELTIKTPEKRQGAASHLDPK